MKLLRYLVLVVILAIAASAAPSAFKTITATTGSHEASDSVKLIGTGVTSHVITWNVTGTIATCSVKLEQSADNITWSDLIGAQACTTNGTSSALATVNYVRINPITLTGTGSLSVTYTSTAAATTSGSATVPAVNRSGLLAEYRFDDGTGTTVKDYSGKLNNGTLAGTNPPVWTTLGLNFTKTGANVSVPAAVGGAKTIIIAASLNSGGIGDAGAALVPNILGSALVGGLNINASLMGGNGMAISGATTSSDAINGLHIHAFELGTNPTTDKIFYEGIESVYSGGPGSSGTRSFTTLGLGYNGTWIGQFYYAVFYDRLLTNAEVYATTQAIKQTLQARGVVFGTLVNNVVGLQSKAVFVGDSITTGMNGAAPPSYYTVLTDTYYKVNLGISGQGLINMSQQAPYREDTYYSTGIAHDVIVIWGGTNDGGTAVEINNSLEAYCRERKKLGWKVVVVTMISRNTMDVKKNSVNAIMRARWGTYADALADVAANPLLGADLAYNNTTYFQADKIHPTDTGNTIAAGIISAAINSLTGSEKTAWPSKATGTYTMKDDDFYIRADPSGGSVTIVLPTAVNFMGQIRRFKNIQTAGANTVTLSAAGASELIDGVATLVVANNAAVSLKSVLTSDTAGGAHWEKIQ